VAPRLGWTLCCQESGREGSDQRGAHFTSFGLRGPSDPLPKTLPKTANRKVSYTVHIVSGICTNPGMLQLFLKGAKRAWISLQRPRGAWGWVSHTWALLLVVWGLQGNQGSSLPTAPPCPYVPTEPSGTWCSPTKSLQARKAFSGRGLVRKSAA